MLNWSNGNNNFLCIRVYGQAFPAAVHAFGVSA
jgi:hypothetical protein